VLVLLPVPVGAQRGEAAEAGLARRELGRAFAHAGLEHVALALQLAVERLHLARGDLLRAVEQVVLAAEIRVRLAHLREQPLPGRGLRGVRGVEAKARQLPRQQVMQWFHGTR
jgi:hypothetical protein